MPPGGTRVRRAPGFASTLGRFPRTGCSRAAFQVSRRGLCRRRWRLWGTCWAASSSADRSVCRQSNVKPLTYEILLHFSVFFFSYRQRLWRPDMWPEGSGNLWLWRRCDTHSIRLTFHFDICWSPLSICEDKPFLLLPPHRGWRWDLLQPGRHHHQHRDDWRGLVEGTVSRTHWSFPGCLRSADAVSDT